MVGNKAQKAVAAALTGMMVLGSAAPAFAGTWTGADDTSWYRINGDHQESYAMGTFVSTTNENASMGNGVYGSGVVKGLDRFDTAFDAISYNVAKGNTPWVASANIKAVVLASGESQADSLVAAGLAGSLNETTAAGAAVKTFAGAPVITTSANSLSIQAKRAIEYYLTPFATGDKLTVYIVGGEAAVKPEVEDAVKAITKGKKAVNVERVSGDDRIATSLEVAKVTDKAAGWLDEDIKASTKNVVYVVNGTAWPDALSVSSFAYIQHTPILLTGADGLLSADQLEYLAKLDKSVTIKVIGGKALPSVEQIWGSDFIRAKVDYKGGVDRYETSAMVIDDFAAANPQVQLQSIAVASGTEDHWADALIGGPFVGANGGVLALVDGVDEVRALKAAYKAQKAVITTVDANGNVVAKAPTQKSFIIGGENAIDAKFATKLNAEFPTV